MLSSILRFYPCFYYYHNHYCHYHYHHCHYHHHYCYHAGLLRERSFCSQARPCQLLSPGLPPHTSAASPNPRRCMHTWDQPGFSNQSSPYPITGSFSKADLPLGIHPGCQSGCQSASHSRANKAYRLSFSCQSSTSTPLRCRADCPDSTAASRSPLTDSLLL